MPQVWRLQRLGAVVEHLGIASCATRRAGPVADVAPVCHAGSRSMEETYSYKGFEVSVMLESVRAVSSQFTYGPPVGYVAVVSICTEDPRRPVGESIALVSEGNRVFDTVDDALATGLNAAKRVIDEKGAP